jgi:hypothetical protein
MLHNGGTINELHYLRLFMVVFNYFWLFFAISPYVTFNYFKLFLAILIYFPLDYFQLLNFFLGILCYFLLL